MCFPSLKKQTKVQTVPSFCTKHRLSYLRNESLRNFTQVFAKMVSANAYEYKQQRCSRLLEKDSVWERRLLSFIAAFLPKSLIIFCWSRPPSSHFRGKSIRKERLKVGLCFHARLRSERLQDFVISPQMRILLVNRIIVTVIYRRSSIFSFIGYYFRW